MSTYEKETEVMKNLVEDVSTGIRTFHRDGTLDKSNARSC